MLYPSLFFVASLIPLFCVTGLSLIITLIIYFVFENRVTRCVKNTSSSGDLELTELEETNKTEKKESAESDLQVSADDQSYAPRKFNWKLNVFFATLIFDLSWLCFALVAFDFIPFGAAFPIWTIIVWILWLILYPNSRDFRYQKDQKWYKRAFYSAADKAFPPHKRVVFWLAIVFFFLAIFCFTFFTEGACIASSPYEVSTRYSRSRKTVLCSGDAPCHIYLTYSEDTAHAIFINFQTEPYSSQIPRVYYDTQSHANSSDLGSYASSKVGRSHRFKTLDMDRGIYWSHLNYLEANTVYYFRAGTGSDISRYSEEKSFATLPDSGPYTFVQGGDVSVSQMAIDITKRAAATNPMFAVVGGDIEYGNGMPTCYRRLDEYLVMWQKYMVTSTGRMIPFIMAIGNHEAGGFQAFNSIASPFYMSWFPQSEADDDPATISDRHNIKRKTYHAHYISNDTQFFSLDSEVQATADGEQLTWFVDTLKNNTNLHNKFSTYHAPLYPGYRPLASNPSDRLREHWAPVFDEYNLTIGFENHDHVYKRTKALRAGVESKNGTIFIGDGAWGVDTRPLVPIPEDKLFYLNKRYGVNFVLSVSVNGMNINVSAIDVDGNVFDNVTRQDHVWYE